MHCTNCGKELPRNAKFCNACGAPAPQKSSPLPQGEKVTENIVLGTDGKYHWYYEFKLMKNPTILFLLLKMFFWISFGIFAFITLIDLCSGYYKWETFLGTLKLFAIATLVMEGVTVLGYLIYALIQGWKYCVMFEMDDNGVMHTQMPKQFKKAQATSLLAVFAGLATKNPGLAGTGMLAAAKQSMYSSWPYVRSVEIMRKRNVIKVNERLNKNQVYAEDADFPFVEDFIRSHVSSKCKITE